MSCSLRDAVTLEERGVPVVVLATTPFMNSTVAHAELLGRPDFVSTEVTHPLVSLGSDEVDQRADTVTPVVVARLLGKS
ncbi:MAG: hypothetical protein HY329_07715 [Chloroflexi bacterium]|nr:hypothetical protein [Chloroflexota bacterium]